MSVGSVGGARIGGDMAESVSAPKYHRGQNPRSLANLRPPWKGGETGVKRPGPEVTPALRRLLALLVPEFASLNLQRMNMAEQIAYTLIYMAAQPVPSGDRAREQILDRVDGALAKAPVFQDNRLQVLVRSYDIGCDPKEIG